MYRAHPGEQSVVDMIYQAWTVDDHRPHSRSFILLLVIGVPTKEDRIGVRDKMLG
jgi:hypothetical protein